MGEVASPYTIAAEGLMNYVIKGTGPAAQGPDRIYIKGKIQCLKSVTLGSEAVKSRTLSQGLASSVSLWQDRASWLWGYEDVIDTYSLGLIILVLPANSE
ncbi:macrophage migration inhibitory factor [Platysternon megacephalum]|uniref:Macrophage migration inhibitory factor n=1 Tax=Platysternon megacephalum TaxID=55544 RepID=A0A4D9EZZ6_9SAUR|nr:macrophage migration inhibitory factor [Platysternon megacephalum]